MALNKNCKDTAYLVGRCAAYYERYAGKRFHRPGSFTKLFTEPEGAYQTWHRYAAHDTEYMEVAAQVAHPVHLLPIEVGQAWMGYYHQRAAWEGAE